MASPHPLPDACPHDPGRDDRKSAAIAARHTAPEAGARLVGAFGMGREILRSPAMKQAGVGADQVVVDNPDHVSVFFLDGERHRSRRSAIARFFTPKAIATRYQAVMESETDALLAGMRRSGRARLDQISFDLAVKVAAEIVGLTNSDPAAMSRRIRAAMSNITGSEKGPARLLQSFIARLRVLNFHYRDVRPAVRARRIARKEDVLSHLIDEGHSEKALLIECLTYATAGMVTTREFIVMVAWHLFDHDALRARFLAGDEADQVAILEEILRLEPVAALLYRRMAGDGARLSSGNVAEESLLAIDIRAANVDEAAAGACPFAIDPDRAKRMRMIGSYLSFGDGPHRCPGSQVALQETRVFIDRLLRVPGIRLQRAPDMRWNSRLMSYELRNAIVLCDRA